VWEPIYGKCVANTKGAGDVAFVASVMFSGGANLPRVTAVRGHVGALVGGDMHNEASAWRGKRTPVEIEKTVDAGVGRKLGLLVRGAKEIKCDVGLRH
jgi:tetrahydromethanopterin S-methyltransferase subunit H